MNLAGIETQGSPDHKFQYNEIEKEDGFGLNWNMAEFRVQDPQLGRLWQIDPILLDFEEDIDNNEDISPYSWVQNNPILFLDMLGLDTTRSNQPTLPSNPNQGDVHTDANGIQWIYTYENGQWVGKGGSTSQLGEVTVSASATPTSQPASKYDYSQGDLPEKQEEDIAYIKDGGPWYEALDRFIEILARDWNAPGNEQTVDDVKDLFTRKPGFPKPGVIDPRMRVRQKKKNKGSKYDSSEKEHREKKRRTRNKHEEGKARKDRDKGGEKGDARRRCQKKIQISYNFNCYEKP